MVHQGSNDLNQPQHPAGSKVYLPQSNRYKPYPRKRLSPGDPHSQRSAPPFDRISNANDPGAPPTAPILLDLISKGNLKSQGRVRGGGKRSHKAARVVPHLKRSNKQRFYTLPKNKEKPSGKKKASLHSGFWLHSTTKVRIQT